MKTNIFNSGFGSNRSSDNVSANANALINHLKQKGGFKILKNPILYLSGILSCLLVLITFTFTSVGCEKPKTIPASNEQTNTDNLIGNKWKLVKFVNVSEDTTKDPEPSSEHCYWIIFNNDSTLLGKSSTNDLYGNYQINTQTSTIQIYPVGGTKRNELFDGRFYMECLSSVCSFEVTDTYLKLFYNKTDYLLFNPYANENMTICNVDNPLIDLPWLKQIVDNTETEATNNKVHVRIYQCAYKDGTGFLLEPCVGCPDMGYSLYDCEGNHLCVMWGFANNQCKEFEVDFDNKKLIWELNNL
jgi:hypothetical protein